MTCNHEYISTEKIPGGDYKAVCRHCGEDANSHDLEETSPRDVKTSACMVCYMIGTHQEIRDHKCKGIAGRMEVKHELSLSEIPSQSHPEWVINEINAREALVKELIKNLPSLPKVDDIVDFIIADRKRIVEPLIKWQNDSNALPGEFVSARNAITETLKRAGIEK